MSGAAMEELLVFHVEEPQGSPGTANAHWSTYRHFINQLRRSYPPNHAPHGRLHFDIVLRSNLHQIKLRLERVCYYMIGYQMETPHMWIELGAEWKVGSSWIRFPDYGIVGSSLLGMISDYETLERGCGQTRGSIALGQRQLTSAVNLLAISTSSRERARSLIIVTLMICEGIRYSQFADYLAARFHENLPTPQWMRETLDSDSPRDAVTCLKQCIRPAGEDLDYHPSLSETIPRDKSPDIVDCDLSSHKDSLDLKSGDEENPDVNLIDQALLTVNSDLVAPDEVDSNCHHPRECNLDIMPCKGKPSDISPANDVTSNVDPPWFLLPDISTHTSYEFSEIFAVRVISIKGMHSCSFYGKISIGHQSIYARGPEQSDFVQPGDLILLSGPLKPIAADYAFSFGFALMGEHVQSSMKVSWYDNKHDELIYDEFYGEHCSLSVCFAALQTAWHATLTVIFIDEDRKDIARVYGQLSACCDKLECEIVLFQKKAEECIDVCPGKAIRLLREVVTVPLNSHLVLRANLFEYSDTYFDQEITKCSMEFPLCHIDPSQEFEKITYGESGRILVKVMWNFNP